MMITLYRADASGSLQYYTVHDRQCVLFTPFAFTSVWSKEDGRGRERLHAFDSEAELDAALESLLRRRMADGYRMLYSFVRPGTSVFARVERVVSAPRAPGCGNRADAAAVSF